MDNKIKKILGCKVDLKSFDEAFSAFEKFVQDDCSHQIITINPEMITAAQNDEEFMTIINESDMNIPDGIGVTLALRILGVSQERVPGIDFSAKVLEYCAKNGFGVALIGAKFEVIEKACENLKAKYEGLNIVFCHDGYFENEDEILSELQKTNPKVLLLGVGSPRQEKIIYKYKKILNRTIMIGVGGSFDVFSGIVKRAPVVFQKLGLEWFYRLAMQPERFSRVFPALPLFLVRVILNKRKES
ncbi:MAG: WecB/TagA/CpsF family glycosyltransferase [Candidatus Gastranaerophilales bacterium]|nr:WecB/TagA/CpsF family glycosyltransferase [Candidatus Gastranaerophilales bacterium]